MATTDTTPLIFPYGLAVLFLWIGGWGLLEMAVDAIATAGTKPVSEKVQKIRRASSYSILLLAGLLIVLLIWGFA